VDDATNPYSPGAGRLPAALVGRDAQIAAWDVALRRLEGGRDAQPLALYGLRGVGKTVLLTQFGDMARAKGWLVGQVEARAGAPIRQLIGDEFGPELSRLARPGAGARLLQALKSILAFRATYDSTGTWSVGLDLKDVPASPVATGSLETDLRVLLQDLTAAMAERGAGVALLIDEAQDLTAEELVALSAIAHRATQHRDRLAVAVAGLPSLPRVLTEAKSYAERLFNYQTIGALAPQDAKQALLAPAEAEDVAWAAEAARHVLKMAGGYPYFLQQFGQEAWRAAADSPITLADARVGVASGWHALDTGFFRVRWERATRSEKAFLRAMSADGDAGSATADLPPRLGVKPKSLSVARGALIAKGLIYSPDHGRVAFTVPGMAAFIERQTDQE
jgi:hypothetical protein